jgi:hypothetical protein
LLAIKIEHELLPFVLKKLLSEKSALLIKELLLKIFSNRIIIEKFALLSVSEKTNIIDLAQALSNHDYRAIAMKTAKVLSDLFEVIERNNYKFSEIFDGRVKLFIKKIMNLFRRRMKKTRLKHPKTQSILLI